MSEEAISVKIDESAATNYEAVAMAIAAAVADRIEVWFRKRGI